jgi:hypothetical protein
MLFNAGHTDPLFHRLTQGKIRRPVGSQRPACFPAGSRPGIICLAADFSLINNAIRLFKSNGSGRHLLAGFLLLQGTAADHMGNGPEKLQMQPQFFSIPG